MAKSAGTSPDSESRILGLEQAQAQTSKDLSERLVKIEGLVERQEDRNQNLLYAVLIACVFIVITVAVEVVLSNRNDADYMHEFYGKTAAQKEITDRIETSMTNLQHQIDLLRARNGYLK